MSTIISIDGELVDLEPGTVVAQSLKAFSIGDLTARKFNFTNGFTIPQTPNNDRIYGNSGEVDSGTLIPYRRQVARIISNGIETVSNGIHTLRDVENGYNLYITSGAKSFDEAIQGKKLTDLDLSALNGSWAPADVGSYRNTTTGVVAPVLNYGKFTGSSIDVDTYLPSVYWHTIINQIFIDSGFAKSGVIFSDDQYLKTIIPYSRKSFDYDKSFAIPYDFVADLTTLHTLPGGTNEYIEFDTLTKLPTSGTLEQNAASPFNDATTFTNTSASGIFARYLCLLNVLPIGAPTPSDFTVEILLNQVTVLATVAISPSLQDITLDTNTLYPDGVPVAPGDIISVHVTPGATPGDVVQINTGRFYSQTLTKVYTASGDVEFGKLLPDMKQSDFIKDFAITYGLIFKELNGTVYVKSIQSIIADRANAVDWTSKRVNKKETSMSFTRGEYAQENYFNYQITDDLLDDDYGQGVIEVDNENLSLSKPLYDSPYSATFNGTIGLVNNVATIPIFDSGSADYYDFENDPGIRKLIVRDAELTEPLVLYDMSSYNDYKVAYFTDTNYYSLLWESFLEDYYSYLEECLQRVKIPTNQYLLTEIDIANFDFFLPIFDSGSYYMVNEIKTFVPGRVTGVEMFKI